MKKIDDFYFMDLAIKEARKAYKKDEVPVGAIIVKDNKIIAKGYNKKEAKKCAIMHAEIIAIKKASKKLKNWRLLDCTMYVTLEPCAMCASAIMQSRIGKVVIGLEDKKNGAVINGPKIFSQKTNDKPPLFEFGIKAEESEVLLKNFFNSKRTK